jgi:hypothetical protein
MKKRKIIALVKRWSYPPEKTVFTDRLPVAANDARRGCDE